MDEWLEKDTIKKDEDLKTRDRKELTINLTNMEFHMLALLSLKSGLNDIGELLSKFASDLVGLYSNGSIESDKADEWYDLWFRENNESNYYFRYFLFEHPKDIEKLIDDKIYFKEVFNEYLSSEIRKKHNNEEECLIIVNNYIDTIDKEIN